MDRLEEGLEVITRLLRGEAPASYAGRIFQLREALLLPRTALTGGPPILVGGVGPRRTLPLVARFANIWNANTLSADTFRERSQLLDRMLEAEGRAPGAIRRTVNLPIVCGETRDELETRVRGIRRWGYFAKTPLDELLASAKAGWACLVGTPDEIVSQIEAYAAAGVEEVMLQWFDVDDIEGLTVIADEVLPHVRAF
jgi:alkanesulfonate monooxygenase SsuD/methylene tetrahydromethanopterin reductase-like flavin-dependent oxidoreductase (luciferase family)